MSNPAPGVGPVVMDASRRPGRNGVWSTRYLAHREGCRAAKDPHSVGACLDLWGPVWFGRMVTDGTVVACTRCRPNLHALLEAATTRSR